MHLFHKWSKWQGVYNGRIVVDQITAFQYRTCKKCGRAQEKRIL